MELDLLLVIALVSIFGLLYYLITRKNDYFHEKPIPSLPVRPLMGSTGAIMMKKCTFSGFVQSIYNKYSSVKIFGLFDNLTPIYVVCDPELIKQIAIKDFDHFVDHLPTFGDAESTGDKNGLFAKSLFAMNGQPWRDMRATLSPAFTGSKMRQMFALMVEGCKNMVDHYEREAATNGRSSVEIEVKDVISRASMDIIATCAFGLKVDSFKDRDNEFYRQGTNMVKFDGFQFVAKIIALRLFPKLLGWLDIDLMAREQSDYFTKLIRDTVELRESQKIKRHDMIDLLLQARKGILKHQQQEEENEGFATVQESDVGKGQVMKTMSESEMIAQCFIFFVAGFDTLSTCALFTIYEVVRNPSVQEKLYEEILRTNEQLAGESLTYDALQAMKYMDMVVSEALRMWPPVPTIDRLCVRDYNFDDGAGLKFTIDKGTGVWFPAYGLHFDPKYFPNPEQFDPERFSEENRKRINTGTYLPFGVGPRNCIGSRFALMEVKGLLYHMLLKFEFVRGEKTQIPVVLKKGFTALGPVGGLHIRLRLRDMK